MKSYRDEPHGRILVFPRTSNQANERCDFHTSRKVHEGLAEAFWNGDRFTQVNSNEHIYTSGQR